MIINLIIVKFLIMMGKVFIIILNINILINIIVGIISFNFIIKVINSFIFKFIVIIINKD